MNTISERQAARVAGIGYVIIFILAIFANFFVFEALYVQGDVATSAANIAANESLWRLGGLCFLIISVVDAFIAWGLYYLFKKRSEPIAFLSVLLRLGNTLLLAAATAFWFLATTTASYAEYFHILWMIGLFFFGFHLLTIAKLLYKHTKAQSVLAVFLAIAGLAYIADTAALFLLANYEAIASTVLVFVATAGVIGELWFTIWILYKGFQKQ